MFNFEEFTEDYSKGKFSKYRPLDEQQRRGGKGWAFNFAATARFDEGKEFILRFMPTHPMYNPSGYRTITMHRIEQVCGGHTDTVLGYESQPEEQRSTYIDELLMAISEAFWNDPEKASKFGKELKAAIKKLQPWRRRIFPVLVWAVPYPSGKKDKTGKDIMDYRPGSVEDSPVGIYLEINDPPENEKRPILWSRIYDLVQRYPDMADPKRGRNFRFGRNGKVYHLDPEERSPVPANAKVFLTDDYPKLSELFKKNLKTHEEIVGLIRNSWFYPELEELEISLEDQQALDFGDVV